MKKALLLVAIATMLSLSSYAQWSIGMSVGYVYNHYDYDPQYMSGLDYKGHHSFAFDVPMNYQFNNWFGLSSGLSFQQKGFVLNGSFIPEGSEEPNFFYSDLRRNDSYFVVPIMTEFSLGNEDWDAFVNFGAYGGWWHVSNYKYKMIKSILPDFYYFHDGEARKEFNKNIDQRFEFGAIAGIGLKRNLSNSLSFITSARVYVALTPQQKNYQIMHFPSRNTSIIAQIGFLYYFN